MDIFKNNLDKKENLIEEIEIRIWKNLLLFVVWYLVFIITLKLYSYPIFLILLFVNILKMTFYLRFPNIEKRSLIEQICLCLF
ncbi:hypothetical protein DW261_02665 [Fusobacterium varium]|nr:hypothetical protein HMPREF2747_15015 [Fusobacterium sp. HMSC073F01]RHG37889.1 hypothetical protein DW261_02665 [Fusobacterium varium]